MVLAFVLWRYSIFFQRGSNAALMYIADVRFSAGQIPAALTVGTRPPNIAAWAACLNIVVHVAFSGALDLNRTGAQCTHTLPPSPSQSPTATQSVLPADEHCFGHTVRGPKAGH